MNLERSMNDERDPFLENLAAELTDAAYQVALRHGVGQRWLDMQLDLWEILKQVVENRLRSHPMHPPDGETEAWCLCRSGHEVTRNI